MISERFIVTSQAGAPVVRTDSAEEAGRYALALRGQVIDRLERKDAA